MVKFLLCVLVIAGLYLVAVGFLHTANRLGWSNSVEQPIETGKR